MREQHTSAFGKILNLGPKKTARGVKIFRKNNKVSELILYNIDVPHNGTTAKSPDIAESFYTKLNSIITSSKGKDLCVMGDFIAEFGQPDKKISSFVSLSRSIRKTYGERLCELLMKKYLVACNTFFKHRACHNHFSAKEGKHHHLQLNRI